MIKKFILPTLSALALMVLSFSPVLAAKHSSKPGGHGGGGGGSSSTPLGNDVSWPQCGKSLPDGQAFGIVGVNNGIANGFNSCLNIQLAWAQKSSGTVTNQPPAQLYLNTGNPGDVLEQYNVTDWPTSSVAADPYGICSGTWTNDLPCSWEYGYERAQADISYVGSANYKFWLDVETANSWTNNFAGNQAALEGMVHYLKSQGASVGLYSTSYQWSQLIGPPSSGSNLNGLDSWLPGARNQGAAQANCSLPPLTAGGVVTLTQFVSHNLDYDYSCV